MLTMTIILIDPNFNCNLRLYLLFVFLLTWFIFANYGGQSQREVIEATFSQLYIAVFLLLLVSIARDWWKDVKVGSQMFWSFYSLYFRSQCGQTTWLRTRSKANWTPLLRNYFSNW